MPENEQATRENSQEKQHDIAEWGEKDPQLNEEFKKARVTSENIDNQEFHK